METMPLRRITVGLNGAAGEERDLVGGKVLFKWFWFFFFFLLRPGILFSRFHQTLPLTNSTYKKLEKFLGRNLDRAMRMQDQVPVFEGLIPYHSYLFR